MKQQTIKSGIDFFRIIAALLVISSHTALLYSFQPSAYFVITEIFARLAVPFFFLTSGYFMIRHYAHNPQPLFSFLKKTAVLYGIAILIYLPLNVYNGTFSDGIDLWKLIQIVLFEGTIYHLWYFSAAMLGGTIAWFTVRTLGFQKAFFFTFLLFLIGLGGDSWYGLVTKIPFLKEFYDVVFTLSQQTRNGLFFAPVYFIAGGWIHEAEIYLSQRSKRNLFLLFFSIMSLEAAFLHASGLIRYSAMYLFQLPSSIALFLCIQDLHVPVTGYERDCSMIMYVIHPWMIVIVRMVAKLTHSQAILNHDVMQFILVSVLSMTAGMMYHTFRMHYPRIRNTGSRNQVITDTDALIHNIHSLQETMHKESEIMAVIKADAYGHDAYNVSTCLEKHGIHHFAVATIDEAIELRHYGITSDILILGYTDPRRIRELHRYHLTQTLLDETYARNLNAMHESITAHIAVDTGMHRIGVSPTDSQSIRRILCLPFLHVTGIFTHLCVSDSRRQEDILFTENQIALFDTCLAGLPANIHLKTHVQASSGLLNYPQLKYDYVRLGISMYGVSSADEYTVVQPDLKPVLSIHSKIVLLRHVPSGDTVGYGRTHTCSKDSLIAVIPIGYADGIPRNLSNQNHIVMVHDTPVPIVGRICMDQMMIDVTDIKEVSIDDEVRIMPSITQAALSAGSISNEILSRLSVRS